ncbi:hypothetical protein MKW94_029552, partial [Papaver nudicaule]|nr:hypothetical protein [Papaver nudicaule]
KLYLFLMRLVSETLRLGLTNVRWFVMGDDDTFFVADNLVRVLLSVILWLLRLLRFKTGVFIGTRDYRVRMTGCKLACLSLVFLLPKNLASI